MAKLERIGNHGFESPSIGAHKTTVRTVPDKAGLEDMALENIQRIIRRSHLKEERNERVYSSFYLKFIQHILATHERRLEGMWTIVEYDGIEVVRFNKGSQISEGRIWLSHGGRMTPTIRRRMNETSEQFGLGFKVTLDFDGRGRKEPFPQKKGTWFVETPSGKVIEWEESNPLTMEIHFPR